MGCEVLSIVTFCVRSGVLGEISNGIKGWRGLNSYFKKRIAMKK